MMSKKQNSVAIIFCSEYHIDIYFIDSFNTEPAQDTIMIIYDVKYDTKTHFLKTQHLVTFLP